jgi:hypothetical protein
MELVLVLFLLTAVFEILLPWTNRLLQYVTQYRALKDYALEQPVWKQKEEKTIKTLISLEKEIESSLSSNSTIRGAEIMTHLRKQAGEANLRVLSIISEGEKTNQGIVEFTVSIHATGSFHNFGKWISLISKDYPNISVRSLSLETKEFTNSPPNGKTEVTFYSLAESKK